MVEADSVTAPASDCCGAPVIVAGRTTHYYVCRTCQKPCGEAAAGECDGADRDPA